MEKLMKDSEILLAVNILMDLFNNTQTTTKITQNNVNLSELTTTKITQNNVNLSELTTTKITQNNVNLSELTTNNLEKYSTKTIYCEAYSKPSDNKDIIHIIQTMFSEFVKKDISLSEMLKIIENNTGYTIQKIVENENIKANILHEEFKTAHSIKKTKLAYYGCNENSVKKIYEEGLSLLENQENTYGCGIYVYTNIFNALCNAKPNKEKNQTIIIVELAEGKTAIGRKGQTDYGDGVMTLTSPNDNVLCFTNNIQAKVKYVITLRYNITNEDDPKLVSQLRIVRGYHPDIWKILKYNKHIIAAMVAQISSKEARSQTRQYCNNTSVNNGASANNGASVNTSVNNYVNNYVNTSQQQYANKIIQKIYINNKFISKPINIGDKVRIIKPNLEWSFLKGIVGEIMIFHQYGKKSHWNALILIKDSKTKKIVIDKNRNKKIQPEYNISWVSIYTYQIEIITFEEYNNNNNNDKKRKNNNNDVNTNKHHKGLSNSDPILID